ncbi:ComEC/Rec2 family competence protein [Ferruginibacter sp. SUN106]|uniref:ComEC/Rec2 family competence protein n=1 Tax=Ferruginibacter sp. SUN106 TaxID=2978348 RepID=UPI003D366821
MPQPFSIPVYKTAPFIRLLLPFIAGIILQWYIQIDFPIIVTAIIGFGIATKLFYFLPLAVRFKLQAVQGVLINLLLLSFGLVVTWQKDIRHSNNWYGNYYKDSNYIIVQIAEPLIEKAKSYKADAFVETVMNNDTAVNCKGKLLLYFAKDSATQQLHYGDRILLNKNLQAIKNSGNPGAFNYERYAAFQQTFHNVFLKEKDWVLLPEKKINGFKQFIFSARENILNNLRKNINTGKDELGIAEALLIGYTNDLDKDLVQAYSNTGVVHIIAISGMHLGLIYVMLVWLFARIPLVKRSKLVQVILILSCLWLFSLLTGASASVLRSAVMFTFITIGNNLAKKSSIYNSLAASAFVMLCYNPYFLWDVGFQLSYLAVVGIIVFQKTIYNLLYIKNKWIDTIWKLMAISLAAQILTFPICIYYFHQFPNLFLITNIIAVPLSSIILYAEIFLVAFSWLPFIGVYAGKITGWLVWLMNKIILTVNDISFAVWDKIPATILSTWLLYAVVIGLGAWLMKKNKTVFKFSLSALLFFVMVHAYGKWQIKNQEKLIVYNVPQHQAIDWVQANDYTFTGDSALLEDGMLQNFHLKPGRIALQLNHRTDTIQTLFSNPPFYEFGNKRVLIIDKPMVFEPIPQKINVDIIIISKSPKLYIPKLAAVFNCKQYVADASNSLWKIGKWKKDCEQLHLHLHSVPEKGAFIVDL